MWNQEPTTEEKEQSLQSRREVDSHVVPDIDYGPDGLNRPVGAGGDIAFRGDKAKPDPVVEDFTSQLDYSESELRDCQESTQPELDVDELEEKLESLIESQNLKEFRLQFNLALVRSLGCGPGDLLAVKEKMMKMKPNDPESKKQLDYMVKVIGEKMRGY